MTSFSDMGHRPHATHTGEAPRNPILKGPEGITVELDAWGPSSNLFPTLYDMLQSNWGDAPSRKADWVRKWEQTPPSDITGWNLLEPTEQEYVESLFAGHTLPQAKELISFSFCVDGVSRACTHQLVRTRIGAAFMQHGGRDNDWRHRPWRMPETIWRACKLPLGTELASPLTSWEPIHDLMNTYDHFAGWDLDDIVRDLIMHCRVVYAALVDAGVPWQDARFLLPDGMTTYIHCNYSYAALEGVLANRLEHVMQWEINCVAQLMLREIKMKCPPLLSKYLGSRSDRTGRDEFAGLESWPPVGKHPAPTVECDNCGHVQGLHDLTYGCGGNDSSTMSGECECMKFSLPTRVHRPEQNPFWVLHPDSMAGGPVVWVPTNGTYPKDF